MNLRLLGLILLLGLLAAGTWWLLHETAIQSAFVAAPKTHEPDYYFLNATVTTLDKKGKPESELTAPRMIHHPDDDSSEVFEPRMRYLAVKEGLPWHAEADHALVPSGGNLIYLDGHVVLQHPDANGGPPLVLQTDKMTVNLDTNIATSDDPVDITQGKSHMTAVGMDAYFKDNRLVLRSTVQGHYVSHHKHK